MKKTVYKALFSGICIGLGCIANLSCANKYLGAFMFSIGLVASIVLEGYLFTGKVGYAKLEKNKILKLILCMLLNMIAIAIMGLIYKLCVSPINIDYRLNSLAVEFFQAVGCGILIYIAVEGYKRTKQITSIILPVAIFIICGFEHCIADTFYLFASSYITFYRLVWILIVAFGNSVGAILIHHLTHQE